MSLALGIKVREGVVLSSDTRIIRHPEAGNYAENGYSKIRLFGQGAAVAVTGDVSLMASFLDRAEKAGNAFSYDKPVAETIQALERFFSARYAERYSDDSPRSHNPETCLLFAGSGKFGGDSLEHFLYRVRLQDHFQFRSEPVNAVAGQRLHGGLYYLTRFRREETSLKEAAFLTYFCTREVASVDPAVSPVGVELILCEPPAARPAPKEWLEEFRLRHENASLQMRSWFSLSG